MRCAPRSIHEQVYTVHEGKPRPTNVKKMPADKSRLREQSKQCRYRIAALNKCQRTLAGIVLKVYVAGNEKNMEMVQKMQNKDANGKTIGSIMGCHMCGIVS